MKYSFPPRQHIAATAKQHGFVARAATRHGLRKQTVAVELTGKNTARLGYFGFLAGTVIHENSGLEHCSQITLFDLKKKIGASSHLQCVDVKEPASLFHTPSDITNDIRNMIYALETLGSNKSDLRSVCIFGTAKVRPAYSEFIMTMLHSLEIPMIGAFACSDADNTYMTDLASGRIMIKPATSDRYRQLFKATRTMPDKGGQILKLFMKLEAYREEVLGTYGKKEFRDYTLQRLAAMYFNDPARFEKKAKRAVNEALDVSIKMVDSHLMAFEHSGDY